jgi:two-component system, OmpR family, sensor histidine kinase BaeS
VARRGAFGLGGLWLRLALAFLAISLTAVVVDTVVTAAGLGSDITAVARQQEAALARSAAFTSGAAYQGVGWARADLGPVFDLASRAGAAVRIRDLAGRLVGSSPGYARYPTDDARTRAIVVLRHRPGKVTVRVGTITVRFGLKGLGSLAERFQAERLRARIMAALIAVVCALVASVFVARGIITPIDRMLTAMRARAAGNRGYRISDTSAPGALRELLEGFNASTDTFDAMDRAQRNLVADVAHEVRTPVAVLQAGTEAIMDGVAKLTQENVASLHAEVLRLSGMVDGLQRLAAAESAGLHLRPYPCDLGGITAEVAERLDDAFSAAKITLSTKLERTVVSCDPDRIRDVVSNLLTNSLKFTPPGGSVTVETGQEGDRAILRVTDTGIGIPADELPRVTERLFRGRRSGEVTAGSGIGMAIVSELVRAHQGQLDISSEEGHGTQVTVRLSAA